MIRLLLIGSLVLAACMRPRQARDSDDASTPIDAEPAVRADDAGWQLTDAKVDAWLSYQHHMMTKISGDAGPLDVTARARRERAVRIDAGLTEDDVDTIEDVVGAVVTRRNLSKLTGGDAFLDFDTATATMTAAQKAAAQQAMADVRGRAQQASSLEAEKAKFGAEAVRVVIAREAEVTKTWDALVEAKDPR